MNSITYDWECLLCGESVAHSNSDRAPPPVCYSCATTVMAAMLAWVVVPEPSGCKCKYAELDRILTEFSANFWREAARMLHLAGHHDGEDDEDDGCDDDDPSTPSPTDFQSSLN